MTALASFNPNAVVCLLLPLVVGGWAFWAEKRRRIVAEITRETTDG